MRAMDIAIFFAFFNVALGMVSFMSCSYGDLAPFCSNVPGQVNPLNAQALQQNITGNAETLSGTNTQPTGIFGWFNAVWQGFFMVISTLLALFGGIVNGTATLLSELGVPWYFSWAIQSVVWIIYIWGIAQYLSGRSGKEAQ
jgi:hypothetical protein